jgi:predicted MFS family arabinose efflux permease
MSATGVGFTLAAFGSGMIVGALMSSHIVETTRFGTVLGLGPVTGFAGSLVLLLTIWLPWPSLAAQAGSFSGSGRSSGRFRRRRCASS